MITVVTTAENTESEITPNPLPTLAKISPTSPRGTMPMPTVRRSQPGPAGRPATSFPTSPTTTNKISRNRLALNIFPMLVFRTLELQTYGSTSSTTMSLIVSFNTMRRDKGSTASPDVDDARDRDWRPLRNIPRGSYSIEIMALHDFEWVSVTAGLVPGRGRESRFRASRSDPSGLCLAESKRPTQEPEEPKLS